MVKGRQESQTKAATVMGRASLGQEHDAPHLEKAEQPAGAAGQSVRNSEAESEGNVLKGLLRRGFCWDCKLAEPGAPALA